MSQTQLENLASWVSVVLAGVGALLLSPQLLHGKAGGIVRALQARLELVFSSLASRTALCFVLIPAMSFTVHLIVAKQHGIPRPLIHDEYSYLLAADTFSQGRVTNPTPPLWEHFETPQELMRPTYMSKYPPGQGIALAIGQVATGEPIVGVWLSTAAACAAIYWMLLAFVSPRWALLGGIVAVLCPELIDWSRVYWGGSVAVLGGALLLGSWGGLMQQATILASILFGVSLVILANSRPFEGMILAVPMLIAACGFANQIALIREAACGKARIIRSIVPAAIILLIGLIGMGWYNVQITGHVLRMPFMEYARQYDVYPKFWFLPMHAVPAYHNESLKWVALEFEKGQYQQLRTIPGFVTISLERCRDLIHWQAKPLVLLLPLIPGCFVRDDRRLRWVRISIGLCLAGLLAESFLLPHYAAPMLPLVLLLVIVGWKNLSNLTWRNRPIGRLIASAILIGFLAGAGMIVEQPVSRDSMIVGHAALEESDALATGRHLIFVKYAPGHSFNNEYVFNRADLARSRVIWARSLGPAEDHRVVDQFPDREVWRLTVGEGLNLDPYNPERRP